jgi:hypothetical protein
MSIARLVLSFGSVVAVSFSVLGCAARPVPQREVGLAAGDGGASAAVVFATPELLAAAGPREIAQSDWRDDSLNIRPVRTAYEQAAWPDVNRPAFDRSRRVIFSSQSNSVTYFRVQSDRRQQGYVLP